MLTVHVRWTPQRNVDIALVLSALAVAFCVVLALRRPWRAITRAGDPPSLVSPVPSADDQPVHESPSLRTAKLTDLLHEVIRRGHPVASAGVYQGWLEVDTFDDYRRAWSEVG